MAKSDDNIGASIMGRHMFGPPPDAKDKEAWKGWWGENPPYHHPVFVLSHQKKASFDMKGGTSFTFVTDGIESALKQAFAAAKGKDVRLAGGPATVRQYLKAGLIDELHLVQVPLLMGQGERIFEDVGGVESIYECVEFTPFSILINGHTKLTIVAKKYFERYGERDEQKSIFGVSDYRIQGENCNFNN